MPYASSGWRPQLSLRRWRRFAKVRRETGASSVAGTSVWMVGQKLGVLPYPLRRGSISPADSADMAVWRIGCGPVRAVHGRHRSIRGGRGTAAGPCRPHPCASVTVPHWIVVRTCEDSAFPLGVPRRTRGSLRTRERAGERDGRWADGALRSLRSRSRSRSRSSGRAADALASGCPPASRHVEPPLGPDPRLRSFPAIPA